MTPDTVFAIASMSKTFTSALILGLVDDGKLSLDAKVATLLPGGHARHAAATPIPAGVTVRMLLDHTSGLADYFFGKGIDTALMASGAPPGPPAQALAYVGQAARQARDARGTTRTRTTCSSGSSPRTWPGRRSPRSSASGCSTRPGSKDAYVQVAEQPRGPLAIGYYYNSRACAADRSPLADAAGRSSRSRRS